MANAYKAVNWWCPKIKCVSSTAIPATNDSNIANKTSASDIPTPSTTQNTSTLHDIQPRRLIVRTYESYLDYS